MAMGEYRPELLADQEAILLEPMALDWAWSDPQKLAERYRTFYEELNGYMMSDHALALTRDLLKCEQNKVLPLLNEVAD